MAKEVYLTKEGHEKLKAKYADYVNVRRAEASEKIRIAREYGDLSENAEYDAAKEEQAMIESEIKTMEAQLNNVVIIDDSSNSTAVRIGSTVTIKGENGENTYEIVGSTEANIKAVPMRISNESPVAHALIGHKVGETCEVNAPSGFTNVKIIKIVNA